ncbi:MAG: hypothetical protein PVF70_02610 [Anaerolineales bacterium]
MPLNPSTPSAVTADTHRLVGLLIWSQRLKGDHPGAGNIGHVGFEHQGADSILVHQFGVSTESGTDLG